MRIRQAAVLGAGTIAVPEEKWTLAQITAGAKPVLQNESAALWDIGDGIACLEFTRRMDLLDAAAFYLIEKAIVTVANEFAGLVIGDDSRNFSAGLDLKQVLKYCKQEDWEALNQLLQEGQQMMMALQHAPFPVVGAAAGKALGGGCEMLLHCDCVQAHQDSQIGLVETRIGVVPSWGGCTEMLRRHLEGCTTSAAMVQAAERVFSLIADAKVSHSAEEAKEMHILRDCCGITMNRERLLQDAKSLCLSRVKDYTPPESDVIRMPTGAVRLALEQAIEQRETEKGFDAHRGRVLQCLAYVLSGGDSSPDISRELELEAVEGKEHAGGAITEVPVSELLYLERKAFMVLIKSKETQQQIKEVL